MGTDGFLEFTFGEGDEKIGKKAKSLKLKEGETYRVSFVWFTPDGKPRFTGCERHYVQGVGYFLHKSPEYARLAGGPPKQAVATILVLWPTDAKGRLNVDSFKRGEGHQVLPWIFSADKFDMIKRRHESFPVGEHDLLLACTDTQFQKVDISPEKDSLFQKLQGSDNPKAKAVAKAIMDEVAEVEKEIKSILARDLTLDQIREKMGGASSGGPASAAATNVDDLVDGLLDD